MPYDPEESRRRQQLAARLVDREVYANVGFMVEYILQQEDYDGAPFTIDDVENLYVCEGCGECNSHDQDLECPESGDVEDWGPAEVYEWWMVSHWLIRRLAEMGHAVILEQQIWGRPTTGQAIALDCSVQAIALSVWGDEDPENTP